MNLLNVSKLILSTGLVVLGFQTVSLADTGQLGVNGADNGNQTTITNHGNGPVQVDNTIDNTQTVDNSVERHNSDDINNGSGSSITDNSKSKSTNFTFIPAAAPNSNQFTHQVTLPNGENIVFGCPNKTSAFNIGGPYGGLGFSGSSSKIPKDCVPLIEKSQLRYSMYDAQRAACGLGPGYLYELNKTLFAKTMAEIKATTYTDELRLMSTAEVNQTKVSMLSTYNSVCGTNHAAVDDLPPAVTSTLPVYTPVPTSVDVSN